MNSTVFLTATMLCMPQLCFAEEVAGAQGKDSYSGLRGIGATSCEKYLELESFTEMQDAVMSWTYGYWSGVNLGLSVEDSTAALLKDLFDQSVEKEALLVRIKARCLEDKTTTISAVAMDIFWDLPTIQAE